MLFPCGCASNPPVPEPLVIEIARCPYPMPPELPLLHRGLSLDAPDNVNILMERDDCMRGYILGLRRALECYETQASSRVASDEK